MTVWVVVRRMKCVFLLQDCHPVQRNRFRCRCLHAHLLFIDDRAFYTDGTPRDPCRRPHQCKVDRFLPQLI